MTNPLHEAQNLRQIIHTPQQPRFPYFLFLVVFLTVLLIIPATTYYKKEACVWSSCSIAQIEQMVADHNGLYPPNAYERDTWEWVRAWHTYNN